jgi:hypothetical protein
MERCMKKLTNGEEVVDRVFYYLLDFKDREEHISSYVIIHFKVTSLRELTKAQIGQYFKYATKQDSKELSK